MRVVIAEDTALLREGLAGLLEDDGHEVVGRAGDADALLALVQEHAPDLAVVDVRMPPDYDDEGTRAAARSVASTPTRRCWCSPSTSRPATSSSSSPPAAASAICSRTACSTLTTSSRRRGGSPRAARHWTRRWSPRWSPRPRRSALDELTPREREVLSLMAEGRTNAGIAKRLWLTEKTVETHIRTILMKLGLPASPDDHRRVLAVLTYLRDQGQHLIDGPGLALKTRAARRP